MPTAILEPEAREFYCHTLGVFDAAGIDFLIGGAYAFACYTGIERHTKDCDIFVRPADFDRTLRALEDAGFATEVPFPHWLGKARHGEYFVDLIYSSGNGVARVDDEWFVNAGRDRVFDVPVRLCPPEEMVWSKALIQERERFDGADVAHLLLARGAQMDWSRMLRRFGRNWRPLLSHLVLFGFIYPNERTQIPAWVMRELLGRLERELGTPSATQKVCAGTLLSRQQYLHDVEQRGFIDARALPDNPMSDEEIAAWTAGIANDGSR
jgi:hypothetical protein